MSRARRFLLPFLAILLLPGCQRLTNPATEAAGPGEYLFCFWNVENFFDNKLDGYSHQPDKEFDAWFAKDQAVRELKLKHLSEALLELNGGRGPDILAIAECETERAADLLRDALNKQLANKADPYRHVLYKDPHGGRHIATAIITRLPVQGDRTRLLGRRQRILEGRIEVNGHVLIVIASHWTSRISEKEGEERKGHGRSDYGDKIYGEFRAMFARNPAVDLLICGDFNDTPDDTSVTEHLHAISDINMVRGGFEPVLFNLFANKDPDKFGTHYHRHWFVFDQLVVSPGMLDDKGWSVDPESATAVRTLHKSNDRQKRPWSFGTPKHGDRGYSDHFPVTVKLRVAP
jgi:endonuclease/exonuclease/phosphatase family metal-dependent hydrolase